MSGFSAHADHKELLDNSRHLAKRVKQTFVVHGEDGPALTHAQRLRDHGFQQVEVPSQGQEFVLAK